MVECTEVMIPKRDDFSIFQTWPDFIFKSGYLASNLTNPENILKMVCFFILEM